MEKMRFESVDGFQENIRRLADIFPSCVKEQKDNDGKTIRKVDINTLQLLLGINQKESETCEFSWVGKREAVKEVYKPIRKTLRPVVQDSVEWDSTGNLYIEGDNLDVLKLLQESYLDSVKVIYIDPPYNTGNDFVYEDDFVQSTEEYMANSGQLDEEGNRLMPNTESNGRFHTDWLNMIYPRLRIAKDLLADDGVIFLSIDDNEKNNLMNVCNEIFGRNNLVGVILWKKKTNGNNMGFLPPVHDYVLCYAKNLASISDMGYPVTAEFIAKTFSNPDNDPRGAWTTTDLSANHKGPYFAITNPHTGEIHYPPNGRYWVFNEQEVLRRIADGRIIFGKSGNGKPVQKVFAANRKFSKVRADSWWDNKGMNEDATKELTELFGEAKLFTHPKPSKLLYHICKIYSEKNDYVLDFFSGSATTAHAVMKLNAEDGRNRKFIMVQLPEETDEKSEAYKAGYKNICEIGKERIRRAAKKIAEENPDAKFDGGFRVLKCDTSNMKDVYYSPSDFDGNLLDMMADNIKEDRTPEDLLFQVMLDLGVELSSKIEETTIAGKKVFDVADGFLIACFDKDVNDETIKAIAQKQPYYFVMRDSSLANDSVATNFEQIFATYSPDTVRKVL